MIQALFYLSFHCLAACKVKGDPFTLTNNMKTVFLYLTNEILSKGLQEWQLKRSSKSNLKVWSVTENRKKQNRPLPEAMCWWLPAVTHDVGIHSECGKWKASLTVLWFCILKQISLNGKNTIIILFFSSWVKSSCGTISEVTCAWKAKSYPCCVDKVNKLFSRDQGWIEYISTGHRLPVKQEFNWCVALAASLAKVVVCTSDLRIFLICLYTQLS